MSTTTKLELKFFDSEGQVITHNYNYADAESSASDVASFATAIINNKDIYAKPPQGIKSAQFVTTTKNEIDLP